MMINAALVRLIIPKHNNAVKIKSWIVNQEKTWVVVDRGIFIQGKD